MKIEITEQIRIKIETSWIGRTPTPSNFSSSAHCHLEHMLVRDDGRSRNMGSRRAMIEGHLIKLIFLLQLQSNLVIRNVLKLVLRNHFPLPIDNLLHKYKEHLALRNNFRVTKKFLTTNFDCTQDLSIGKTKYYKTKKPKTKMLSFYKQQSYFSQIVSKVAKITISFL